MEESYPLLVAFRFRVSTWELLWSQTPPSMTFSSGGLQQWRLLSFMIMPWTHKHLITATLYRRGEQRNNHMQWKMLYNEKPYMTWLVRFFEEVIVKEDTEKHGIFFKILFPEEQMEVREHLLRWLLIFEDKKKKLTLMYEKVHSLYWQR